jgi:hypothetical protein
MSKNSHLQHSKQLIRTFIQPWHLHQELLQWQLVPEEAALRHQQPRLHGVLNSLPNLSPFPSDVDPGSNPDTSMSSNTSESDGSSESWMDGTSDSEADEILPTPTHFSGLDSDLDSDIELDDGWDRDDKWDGSTPGCCQTMTDFVIKELQDMYAH